MGEHELNVVKISPIKFTHPLLTLGKEPGDSADWYDPVSSSIESTSMSCKLALCEKLLTLEGDPMPPLMLSGGKLSTSKFQLVLVI